ncbi:M48 family metallopeptidase [Sulfurirhabdus autotrophica]|uniref:STE24 endopeptidase n=1 Tax=Sulfurirhabdus autotrophica TaxID=1706046 RepID=A0A4R3YEQ2_9PROT|nr:M48 family metallopeptidase [Sulfurirhabdus autotrophica]TCV88943.1 STE24 endopeptidase [Sulfurirhabdus autotrophica]
MQTFTLVFLIALLLTTLTKLWLAARHVRHIQAHRDAVPQEFSEQIALDAHQKAADYSSTKTRLSFIQIMLDAVLLLAFTLGGGLQILSDFWATIFNAGIAHSMALIISPILIISILEFPLNVYFTFVVEARFGFNKMTPALFIVDMFKQLLLASLFGLPFLAGVLWLMDKMGEKWWLYVWFAWMGFNLLVLAIYPTFIAPFFNKFTPMEDMQLKTRIEQFLTKCGFKAEGLFVMDGSKRSSHGNAYFTGFGKSKRIVFFDTLLTHLTHNEIEAVLAHELGHFKRRHIIKRIVWTFILSLGFLWLLGWLMDKTWFYQGLGVTTQSTGMALILFFMIIPAFTFLFQPLSSFYSRKHEFEADQYAAQNANANDMVQALVKLYKDNASTLTPDPLHSVFYDSHPPAATRIARLLNAGHNT